MKTVAQIIERYNKQHSDTYDYIVVSDPHRGGFATLTYHDVTNITQTKDMLSFYGKSMYEKTIGGKTRFVRINNANVIRSEV